MNYSIICRILKSKLLPLLKVKKHLQLKAKRSLLMRLKGYDENNIPSEILIGANVNGKAFALKTLIASFQR